MKEYIADGLMLGTFGLGCVIAGSYASEHDLLMSLAYLAFAGLIAVQIFRELQESHPTRRPFWGWRGAAHIPPKSYSDGDAPDAAFALRVVVAKSKDGSDKLIASGDAVHAGRPLNARVVGTDETAMCARILVKYADYLATSAQVEATP